MAWEEVDVNMQMSKQINDLMAQGSREVIHIDPAMLLRVYRREGVPVLLRWEHIIPFESAPVGVGYRGVECDGLMSLHPDYGTDVWTVVEFNPLTLSPSMSCRRCGAYGEVKEGTFIGHVPIPSPEEGLRRETEYREYGYCR